MSQTEKSSQPWLKYLEEESKYYHEDSWQMDVHHILMEFLQSENSDAAVTARRIDTNYSQQYVGQHRYVLSSLDKGMEQYIFFFYEVLFPTVRFIPYNDPRQKNVVQLLVEFQKLPARPFIRYDEEFTDMVNNPIVGDVVRDKWNAFSISDNELFPLDQASQLRAGWMNFSAFLARCDAAGLEYFNSCPGARLDIPNGLEPHGEELSQELKDAYVTVAANYLIISPEELYGWFVLDEKTKAPTREWGITHWRMWAKSLKELEKYYEGEGEEGAELMGLVKQARRKVLEVGKDLFVDEEVEGDHDVAEQLQKATFEDKDCTQADETTELVAEASAEKGTEKSVNDVVEKQTDAVEGSQAIGNTDEVTPSDGTQTESDAIITTAEPEESHDAAAVTEENHNTTVDSSVKGEAEIVTNSDHTTAAKEDTGESVGDMTEKDT